MGPCPGAPSGTILALWNPDASWEGDEALSVYAIHGGITRDGHFVYDHIEVSACVCGRGVGKGLRGLSTLAPRGSQRVSQPYTEGFRTTVSVCTTIMR